VWIRQSKNVADDSDRRSPPGTGHFTFICELNRYGKTARITLTDLNGKRGRTLLGLAVCTQLLLVGLAIWYSETMPSVPANAPRPLVHEVVNYEDLVFADTDIAPVRGKQLPPIDVSKAVAGDPAQVQTGAQLFSANCATCHGQNARGMVLRAPYCRHAHAI
jgi:hypothetical protein